MFNMKKKNLSMLWYVMIEFHYAPSVILYDDFKNLNYLQLPI